MESGLSVSHGPAQGLACNRCSANVCGLDGWMCEKVPNLPHTEHIKQNMLNTHSRATDVSSVSYGDDTPGSPPAWHKSLALAHLWRASLARGPGRPGPLQTGELGHSGCTQGCTPVFPVPGARPSGRSVG